MKRSGTSKRFCRTAFATIGRRSFFWGLILFFSPFAVATELQRYEFESLQMGVSVRIVLYTTDAEAAKNAAEAGFEQFRRLNTVMSDYDSESELSMLTERRKTSDAPIPVSDDLFAVLKYAKHFSSISDGAFDVTVGPLTRLWRRSKRQRKLPEPQLLEQSRALVGNEHWELDDSIRSVRLLRSGVRFDLGGIAKGYAIDRAFETIRQRGFEIVLVDAGGDFRLGKSPPGGWRIEIDGETVTTLKNIAMATSGDKLRFVEIDDVRYSHLIDPKTGLGLTESSTVHVFASTAVEADALASTLSVLGSERGILVVEAQKNASAKIILHEGDRVFESKRYQSVLRDVIIPSEKSH